MSDNFDPRTVAEWRPHWVDDKASVDAIFLGTDDARQKAYGDDPRAILAGECLRFGLTSTYEFAVQLVELYARLLRAGMPVEHRWQAFAFLDDTVKRGLASVEVYVPFMLQDPHGAIVCNAVCEYVSDGSLLYDDPMGRPKVILELAHRGEARNAGAIFGALLSLGDPRLLQLLWPLKDTLSSDDLREACKVQTECLHAGTIHFILDWMEGLEADGQDLAFGTLVTSLIVRRRAAKSPRVATGLRPFPYDSVSSEEAKAMLKVIPIEEFTAGVGPRMIALAETEPEPRLMPAVLKVWGLGREDLWNEWSDKIDAN